jgi:hypothetical protein
MEPCIEPTVPGTALITWGQSLRIVDLLTLGLPGWPEEAALDILWEYTGWPGFFHLTPEFPTPLHRLLQQLKAFREGEVED